MEYRLGDDHPKIVEVSLPLLAFDSHTHSHTQWEITIYDYAQFSHKQKRRLALASSPSICVYLTQRKPNSHRSPLTMRQAKPQDIFRLSKYNKYLLVAVFIARDSPPYINSTYLTHSLTYLYHGISFRYC